MMSSAQSQAWDVLKDIEKQAMFLEISEGKSSCEAGIILGISHYKYLELKERAHKFFKLFTDFYELHGSIFRPDSPCEPMFRDFIEACLERRMPKKEARLMSGDSSMRVPSVSRSIIVRNMNLLQDSDDEWDVCTRKLIFEFDRWNSFRILPRMLQQPSAYRRRENKREKILLRYLLQLTPDFALERIREKWFYKVKPSKPAYWVALISKNLYTDGYYLLKVRPEDEVVKEMTRFYLYVFKNREDADTYGFLVTQYLDRTLNIKLSQKYWPEYRAIVRKAINWGPINNLDINVKNLDMAFDRKPRKPKKRKRVFQGENHVPAELFYKK